MMLLYLTNGDCVEVESAVAADLRRDQLICFDGEGREVASHPFAEVEAYTVNQQIANLLLDEVCEDVTVIPAAAEGDSDC